MQRTILGMTVALLLYAIPARADHIHINEIYASHASTDDREFIELIGTPNMSLDAFSVVIIEGDGTSSGLGQLDRVWELAGEFIPDDGYFVLGDTAVLNSDFDIGTSNRIENGTNTYLLIENLTLALNDDIDADNDGTADVTLASLGITHDIVAMMRGANISTPYFGAPQVGPDGSFLPAGIYRPEDYPRAWATDVFLDFDDEANLDFPRTPGAKNSTPEPASLALLALGAVVGLRRRR